MSASQAADLTSRSGASRVLTELARSVPGDDPRERWHVHMLLGQLVSAAHHRQDQAALRAAAAALRHFSPGAVADVPAGDYLSTSDLVALAGEGSRVLEARPVRFDGRTYAAGPLAGEVHRRDGLARALGGVLGLGRLEPYGVPYYHCKGPRSAGDLGVHKLGLPAAGAVPVALLVVPLDHGGSPGVQYLPPPGTALEVGARRFGKAVALVGSGVPFGVAATGQAPATRLELAYVAVEPGPEHGARACPEREPRDA